MFSWWLRERVNRLLQTAHTLHTYKWRYSENATIIKYSISEASKEGDKKNNQWQTNATYETDAQTQKNCNRGTALEWSVEKVPRPLTSFTNQRQNIQPALPQRCDHNARQVQLTTTLRHQIGQYTNTDPQQAATRPHKNEQYENNRLRTVSSKIFYTIAAGPIFTQTRIRAPLLLRRLLSSVKPEVNKRSSVFSLPQR